MREKKIRFEREDDLGFVEMRHDLLAPGDRREREAAADDLAQGAQIRHDTVIFLGAAIGEAEPRHDLVEDQRHPILGGDLAQFLEKAGRRRDDALKRLDDDAGELVPVLLDQAFDDLRVVERRDDHVVAHAFWDAGRVRHRRREIPGAFRCQRHQRIVAHAVIAALEFQDLVAPRKGACGAHRVEIGFGAGRHKAHLFGAGHRLDDRLGQFDPQPVVGEKRRALGDLRLRRLGHLRVRVADQHRPGAEQVIDVLRAILVPDATALALADHHLGGEIAEGAARQHPLRLCDDFLRDIAFYVRHLVSLLRLNF